MNDREQEMLDLIDSGVKLSEEKLQELTFEFNTVEETDGGDRRWSRTVTSVVKLKERYFEITWEHGLTEMQENEFYNQPLEVELYEYEQVAVVKEWKPVK